MSISYKITPEGFGWLSQAFAKKSIISPLTLFSNNAKDFNEETKQSFIEQKIVTEDGTLTPEALAVLDVLTNTNSYSRVQILGTDAPVDKVTYFYGNSACALDSGDGGFTVEYPARTKEAGFVFEEFTGSSRFVDVSFSQSFSPSEALALLSLIDLSRAAVLVTLAGGSALFAFSPDEIMNKCNSFDGSLMWFTASLKKIIGSINANSADVPSALASLSSKGLVEGKDGKFILKNDAMQLASEYLLPSYAFNISCGTLISETQAEKSECMVIFCGMHNLLYIDTANGKVLLETISGSDLLGIILGSLSEPPMKNAAK